MADRKIDYWIDLLWRRARIATIVGGGIFAFIFLVTILFPPVYESKAEILVQTNRAHNLISPALQTSIDSSAPIVNNRDLTEQDLNSEVELLNQPQLVVGAYRAVGASDRSAGAIHVMASWAGAILGLPGNLYMAVHGEPPLTTEQKKVMAIQERLSAVVIRKSNMIEVSLESPDPQWTRKFLSALLDQYFDLHSKIEHSVRSTVFFEDQKEILRKRLAVSEEHLRDVGEQTGVVDLNDQSEATVYQLSGFKAELRKNASRLAGVGSQIAALQAGLSDTPMRLLKEVRQSPNPVYQGVETKTVGLQLDRGDILRRYRPNSATAQAATQQVSDARHILSEQKPTIVSEQLSDLSPIWLGLASNLAQARVTYSALRTTQDSLTLQIATYESELRKLAEDGLLVDRANRDVEADQEAYLSYLRKGEEARAELALNQSQIMNVALAAPPYTPVVPVFPRVGLTLLLGLMLGIVAGFGAAWWEERLDKVLYSAFAIFETSRLPVLAMLREVPPDELLATGTGGRL